MRVTAAASLAYITIAAIWPVVVVLGDNDDLAKRDVSRLGSGRIAPTGY
jgi:hypothetical protein